MEVSELDVDLDLIRRRTNAGPWRDKKEFDEVYEWVFGKDANWQTKERACSQMKIWKFRRLNLMPGTILSTLLIIEAQLKDEQNSRENREDDSVILYSSALTRFVNYMSAINQGENMKTMYASARELNLDPFVIDLRHFCAHGVNMPPLALLRETVASCLEWLRTNHWDIFKESMENVDAKKVRKKDVTVFDEEVREMFLVYDAVTEVLLKKLFTPADWKKCLGRDRLYLLKKFFKTNDNETDLEHLLTLAVKSISKSIKRGWRVKDLSKIFLDAMIEMSYFFEAGHDAGTTVDRAILVAVHQEIFKIIAVNGFIEDLFDKLIEIAENDMETVTRRKGSGFWANQIAIGFAAFKQVKLTYKGRLEMNGTTSLDLSTINQKNIANSLLEVYEDLGYSVKGTLIFGDTTKCPWTLSFSQDYLLERMKRISEFTTDVIKSCLDLAEKPLTENENVTLMELFELYMKPRRTLGGDEISYVYTVQCDNLTEVPVSKVMEVDDEQQTMFGEWTKASGDEWHRCPLGRLPWQ